MDSRRLTESPEGTARALIDAGLHLFGHHGYSATSTRAVAARAGANVAAIAYHFGGKAGLRAACAAEVARRLGQVAALPAEPAARTPHEARAALRAILIGFAEFLLPDGPAGDIPPFLLREIGEDGATVDHIYHRLFEPTHRQLCALWAIATGQEAESPATRIAVFSMLGQLVYFRIGQPVIRRRMGWAGLGAAELGAILPVLIRNLDAALDAAQEE